MGTAALAVLVAASCESLDAPVRRAETRLAPGWPEPNRPFYQPRYPEVRGSLAAFDHGDYARDEEYCLTCHDAHRRSFAENVHRNLRCQDCHGPAGRHLDSRGREPGSLFGFKGPDAAARSEVCLRCHEQNACAEGARWRTSAHAHAGVSCTDCHRAHYNLAPGTPALTGGQPPAEPWDWRAIELAAYAQPEKPLRTELPSLRGTSGHLGAVSPGVCYRCHGEREAEARIAGPHQFGGPNGIHCTTCHDPHGQVREETRSELCLRCHDGAPTAAWHSSIHFGRGVHCTDCHYPHLRPEVPISADLRHDGVRRPVRRPMAVQQPEACFKCHPKIDSLVNLPSHHPIREGKMVCSDCHDPHGQRERNLRAATINRTCYRCHGEKEGPFAFEHPPVTENCATCHNPHGAIEDNLLRQPVTSLCLRCHTGPHRSPNLTAPDAAGRRGGLAVGCIPCHPQVHGSNVVNQSGTHSFWAR
jgi:DmsE family decaheme c-type cytochrome